MKFLEYINESLDTPVSFEITDDTRPFTKIYAKYQIDDTQYGISLEETNFAKVYELRVYRILSKKPRLWSFKSPMHVRTSLSTLLSFAASITFAADDSGLDSWNSKISGIVVKIPGSSPAAKFNRFVDLILRKNFMMQLRSIPVHKTTTDDQPYEHLFITKKNISPTALFKSKTFAKYNLKDPSEFTDKIADEIHSKFPQKTTVSLNTSKTIKFSKFVATDVTIDDEVFDQISVLKKERVIKDEKNPNEEKPLLTSEDIKYLDNYFDYSGSDWLYTVYKGAISQKDISLYQKMKKERSNIDWIGPDNTEPSKKYDDLSEQMGEIVSRYDENPSVIGGILSKLQKESPHLYFMQKVIKTYDVNHDMYKSKKVISDSEFLSKIKERLEWDNNYVTSILSGNSYGGFNDDTIKRMSEIEKKYTHEQMKEWIYKYSGYATENASAKKLDYEGHTTNISPEQLISSIEGTGTFDYSKEEFINKNIDGLYEKNEKVEKKKDYIQKNLGYYEKVKALPSEQFQYLDSYTGAYSSDYNGNLRHSFSNLFVKDNLYNRDISDAKEKIAHADSDVNKMFKAFELIEPLPEAIWVYRTTSVPNEIIDDLQAGEVYVDPAFQSTSISSTLNFGFVNAKIRTFLPKGSKVIPMLDHSVHKSEYEIILPPFSVQKVIRIDSHVVYGQRKYLITTVFTGSVYTSFRDEVNNFNLKESIDKLTLKKKDDTYDPHKKFGGINDPQIYKKIIEKIKSGKLTISKK